MALRLLARRCPCPQCKGEPDLAGQQPARFLGKELWPPSSPDYNPLDYYVWGRVRGLSAGPPQHCGVPEDGHQQQIRSHAACGDYARLLPLQVQDQVCHPG